MNKKASELGLTNTNFVTPHGLDEDEHYTTAYELAIITDYALKNKKFATIVNTKTCSISINSQAKMLSNTNELLGNLNGVDGVKTGFTNGAGRCLVTSTTRDGHQIICVVLGADTKKIRTQDSVKLIEYAFSNYKYINAKDKIDKRFEQWMEEETKDIKYEKAKEQNIEYELVGEDITWVPILKEKEKDVQIHVSCNELMQTPVEKGCIIGKISVELEDEVLLSSNIVLKQNVEKKQVGDYMKELINNMTIFMCQKIYF